MPIKPWPWLGLFALLGAVWVGSPAESATAAADSFLHQMNLGKASLENRDSATALAAFQQAVQAQPESTPARRNLARARMLAGQWTQARQDLERARALGAPAAATVYLIGLTFVHESNYAAAIPFLEEAVRLDPTLAPLRFQLANAYQILRQNEKAREQLRETVRLDPLHASAHFKLAMLARQERDLQSFETHNETFQHLRRLFGDDQRTPTALERCRYTQPEAAPVATPLPRPALPVRFLDVSAEAGRDLPGIPLQTAMVLDVQTNGVLEWFALTENNLASIWTMAPNQSAFSTLSVETGLDSGPSWTGSLAGNFRDLTPKGFKYDPLLHAQNDLLLFGTNGVCLLLRLGPAAFSNVTAAAGLAGIRGVSDAAWLDYDHDGDLDLGLAAATGMQLWQNNGDGRFEHVTESAGLEPGRRASALAMADLDQNLGVDLLLAGGEEAASIIYFNERTGRFRSQAEPPGPAPPARRVMVDDLDNDGVPDSLWCGNDRVIILAGGGKGRHVISLETMQTEDVCLLDFDNDGWLDLLAVGQASTNSPAGRVSLWRNEGAFRWRDASAAATLDGLALPPIREVVPGDFDADGDTDLFLVGQKGSRHFLRNEGGSAHGMLQVRLRGTKTNPCGLGTQVEVRAGDFWVTRIVNRLPLEIGVADHSRLDSIKTIWTNGIEDNQMNVAVGPRFLSIAEKNVAAGSCPYLYVWDGNHFRFVTDLLGNSPLGLSWRRGEVLPADPEEWVAVGNSKTVQPRDGFFEVDVTEELREVLYLDEAHWLAVDHPIDTEVHSPDRLGPTSGAPSELGLFEVLHRPIRATGSDGRDRAAALQDNDEIFAPSGHPLPPPLRGMCEPLELTLDFGDVDYSQPLALLLTGWLQYGDASANIAASQNKHLSVIAPQLEAQRPDGSWEMIEDNVGMPAGKTKTIFSSLTGKLPLDTRRLRLTTTFEIHWDRIVLARPREASATQHHRLTPRSAELRWRGFSEIRSRAPGLPAVPDYAHVFPRPPWRTTPWGWCTRYGDVLPLVEVRDEQLVLLNGGDALRLRFAASELPPVAPGQLRSFFFHSVGWDKDADPNVVDGDRVEPLPIKQRAEWIHEYNTRWVPATWP